MVAWGNYAEGTYQTPEQRPRLWRKLLHRCPPESITHQAAEAHGRQSTLCRPYACASSKKNIPESNVLPATAGAVRPPPLHFRTPLRAVRATLKSTLYRTHELFSWCARPAVPNRAHRSPPAPPACIARRPECLRAPRSFFFFLLSSSSWAILQELPDLRPVHADRAEVLPLDVAFGVGVCRMRSGEGRRATGVRDKQNETNHNAKKGRDENVGPAREERAARTNEGGQSTDGGSKTRRWLS